MPSKVENKWHINREKNAAAKKLRNLSLAEHHAKHVAFCFEEPCYVEAYTDGTLWVGDGTIWYYPEKIWEVIDKLEAWLKDHHPAFHQELDEWRQKDQEAARQARLAKIMGAIGNNLEDLPELKDEIVKLARMIENGQAIADYCKNYEEE